MEGKDRTITLGLVLLGFLQSGQAPFYDCSIVIQEAGQLPGKRIGSHPDRTHAIGRLTLNHLHRRQLC